MSEKTSVPGTTADTRPLPTVIGPTENALRALLTKILSPTRIKTYPAWAILNAVSKSDAATSAGNWQLAIADALKIGLNEVDGVLAQLRTAGLINDDRSLTALGSTELANGRSLVSAATSRLVDGISKDEQATARRVLDRVRHQADELLRQ